MIVRARSEDGTFGEIRMDERGRLRVKVVGADDRSAAGPFGPGVRTEAGELLVVRRRRS